MTASINTVLGLTASLLLIAANGFFVAAEFALVAADRVRFDRDAAAGDHVAQRARRLFDQLSFHLSGAQLGITATSLVLGFIAEPAVGGAIATVVGDLPRAASVGLALGLATVFQMVLGELVPKTVAITHADRAARLLSGPVKVYGMVAGPIIAVFENASLRIIRLMGVEPMPALDPIRSLEELEVLFKSSGATGALAPEDVNLLTRSIRFGEKEAADVLVPRVEVAAVRRTDSVADLVDRALETGHSRFPVIGEDLDEIVGVVHVKSIYGLPPDRRVDTPVEAIMGPVLAVPETRPLDDLFGDLRASERHLAVVVDEHGGTAGIVTLEDLLEELVEPPPAHDEVEPDLTRSTEGGTFVVPGGWHADELREACGFGLPEGEYETIAGFLLDRLGHIPEPGERVHHDDWTIEVVAMDRLRIATVRLARSTPARDPGAPDLLGERPR